MKLKYHQEVIVLRGIYKGYRGIFDSYDSSGNAKIVMYHPVYQTLTFSPCDLQ